MSSVSDDGRATSCRRFTLGANTRGWRAICLDCPWVSSYADWQGAKAIGDEHVGLIAAARDGGDGRHA